MDPFTQRMLERARARQEKIDQKLVSSGQTVPQRKPLTENIQKTNVKSPAKVTKEVLSPRKSSRDSLNSSAARSPKRSIQKDVKKTVSSPHRDMIVTKKEFNSPRGKRDSDVSVEINIMHRDDIQIEVQVEERDVPLTVYDSTSEGRSGVILKEIEDEPSKRALEKQLNDMSEHRNDRAGLRHNVKSRLDRLGILYSDKPDLSSPIHRTEQDFSSATPPSSSAAKLGTPRQKPEEGKKKFGRLAALADQINNWEDDLTHHNIHPEPSKKTTKVTKIDADASTLDVSIHSLNDINKLIGSAKKQAVKSINSGTYTKAADCQRLDRKIVMQLADNRPADKGSPVVRRLAPKLNGNADRNSVLSKAAMFEAGSPKAKDPAEMSLRERKALFEKNKGVAIVPKAPFGLAPSAKSLLSEKAEQKPKLAPKPTTKSSESSRTNSKENVDDNAPIGGIKGKLAALFNKEQTISESTIANKNKQEREREMEMLQNRFQYKPKQHGTDHDSDSEHDDNSENAPLMGSTVSLAHAAKKPEIIGNVPKVTFDKTKSESALHNAKVEEVVAAQPNKRRSSQDSPVVLSVLDDVKRIKVNDKKENGAVLNQPQSLYPHLSDIETDTSHTQEEYSDCGGSSDNIVDKLNKSDEWAETSFSREVMKVVKRNNSSYKKAVAESDSDSDNDSELDEMLDEALDDSEGPTPPKQKNSGNVLSSKSFTYEQGSPAKSKMGSSKGSPAGNKFKSPIKVEQMPRDRANELVHSVSFYRRVQSASSTPTTPMRIVRHVSPERRSPDAELAVTTVKEKIRELQAEISKQQTIISQASQALNLCASTIEFSGSTEQAEGERLLLLATHRRQACLHEIQRLQVEGAGRGARAQAAALRLSALSVPLRRDYVRQLNADGAAGHHALCLLKCRDRVLATSLQCTQPSTTLLTFPDEIRIDGLPADFKVTIEVYLLQASKEILPHNVKYHIFNKKSSKLLTPKSKSRTPLKAPRVESPAGPAAVRAPQLAPHGYAIFALAQAKRTTFTLNKLPPNSPLEGTINLSISARVVVPPPAPHAAFLTAFDDVSGLGAWHRRWFELRGSRLTYWKYPDDVQKKLPIGDIDLSQVVSRAVQRAPRDLCARPHTLLLESALPPGLQPPEDSLVYATTDNGLVRRHLLAADTAEDREQWLSALNAALEHARCCPPHSQ